MADAKLSALTLLEATVGDPFNDRMYFYASEGATDADKQRAATPIDILSAWFHNVATDGTDFVATSMNAYGDTGSSNQADSQHQGVVEIRASNINDQSAYWGPYKGVHLQGGAVRMIFVVKTDGTISNNTDKFTIAVGLPNEGDAQRGRDGIYVQYSNDLNGGKWALITSNGGTATSTDTGVTVATDTWYVITIDINAGATSATASINGSTPVTSSTNVYQNDCTFTAGIFKNAGSSQRKYHLDKAFFVKHLATGR